MTDTHKIIIMEYHSNSGLQTLSTCQRKRQFQDDRKNYKPMFRRAALVKGSAIHQAIESLHLDPLLAPEYIFQQELNAIEAEQPDVPVDWGEIGRDGHILDGTKCVLAYWRVNQDIKLFSNERWFYVPVEMPWGCEWMRGRFDQVIEQDGKFVVRELKSGNRPSAKAIQNSIQYTLQAYAFKHGYILRTDEPYIPKDDDNYHLHKWKHIKDTHWKCEICGLDADKYDKFPHKVMIYHIPSLVPDGNLYNKGVKAIAEREIEGKMLVGERLARLKEQYTDWQIWDMVSSKYKEPKGNPEINLPVAKMRFDNLLSKIKGLISEYRTCQRTGIWASNERDFMSPCDGCEYSQYCSDKILCEVEE